MSNYTDKVNERAEEFAKAMAGDNPASIRKMKMHVLPLAILSVKREAEAVRKELEALTTMSPYSINEWLLDNGYLPQIETT